MWPTVYLYTDLADRLTQIQADVKNNVYWLINSAENILFQNRVQRCGKWRFSVLSCSWI